jgi:hypothetical protein
MPQSFKRGHVPKFPIGFATMPPAASPIPLTHHSTYRSDKLSRLAPSSELSERHSLCGIKGLVEGRTLAPILPRCMAPI